MKEPHVILPAAVYDREAARAALGLTKTMLHRALRLGRLRVARRAGRYFIAGEWLLDWLRWGGPARLPPGRLPRHRHVAVGAGRRPGAFCILNERRRPDPLDRQPQPQLPSDCAAGVKASVAVVRRTEGERKVDVCTVCAANADPWRARRIAMAAALLIREARAERTVVVVFDASQVRSMHLVFEPTRALYDPLCECGNILALEV